MVASISPFRAGLMRHGPVPGASLADRRAVEWQVARWFHWHNHDRLHSSIGHLPSVEFEHRHRRATTVVPTPGTAPQGDLGSPRGDGRGLGGRSVTAGLLFGVISLALLVRLLAASLWLLGG